MARSAAPTVAAYLAELPPERRKAIRAVRGVIRKNLPRGYRESMGWGMISYEIPLARYPDTYNGQPLCYAGLAAQKNYNALYLMAVYGGDQQALLKQSFEAAGLKLDMGKSCIRFQTADDLPLDAIGKLIAGVPPERMIELFQKGRKR